MVRSLACVSFFALERAKSDTQRIKHAVQAKVLSLLLACIGAVYVRTAAGQEEEQRHF
jgi:hypothetical protein